MARQLLVLGVLVGCTAIACGDDGSSNTAAGGGPATSSQTTNTSSSAGGSGGSVGGAGGGVSVGGGGGASGLGVGIDPADCSSGFLGDGQRGCQPVLPSAPCPSGTRYDLGQTTCVAMTDCGSGTYGNIPGAANRQHVDASFTGVSSGTAQNPWKTIAEGITAAAPGAIVAVASGTYPQISINKNVAVHGRCAEMTTISGTGTGVTVTSSATGSSVNSVSITAGSAGVANSAADFTLSGVHIHGTGGTGITGLPGSLSRIEQSVVEAATGLGVLALGATVQLVDTTVSKTLSTGDLGDQLGRGVVAQSLNGLRGVAELNRTVIERNYNAGILVFGADLTVTDSVVRDTAPQVSNQRFGRGIAAQPADGESPSVTIEGSVVTRNHSLGIFVSVGDATIYRTTVTNILPDIGANRSGRGISLRASGDYPTIHPSADIEEVTVRDVYDVGLRASGTKLTLIGVRITQISPSIDTQNDGRGLSVQPFGTLYPSTLNANRLLVSGTRSAAISIYGGDATIENFAITDVQDDMSSGTFGDGISVQNDSGFPALVEVSSGTIESAARAGINNLDAIVDVTGVIFGCNFLDLNDQSSGVTATSNQCGCGQTSVDCVIDNLALSAPPPLSP